MINFLLKNAVLIQSSEDLDTFYLQRGVKRYIFHEGKYIGWYRF